MADDSTQIWVGEDKIGIRGLKEAVEEIAQSHAQSTDAEIQDALIVRLSVKNYIARGARKEYGEAFLREFRKFLGQPYEEGSRTSLQIVVLGPGCSQCNRLEQSVKQALTEVGLPASVEHVTDVKEIAKYGFVSTPALVINGIIVSKGTVPSTKKISQWALEASRENLSRAQE